MKHSLEDRIQLHRKLLSSDDVSLFTNGGCHVFALALHERFKYPIRVIPGHSNDGVSHIYCLFAGPPPFAVDALGFTPEHDRVWRDFSGLSFREIDANELIGYFQPLCQDGLCGEDWFVQPARRRAEARITLYEDIFSGAKKTRIPDP